MDEGGTTVARLTRKGQATRDRIVAAAAKLMFEQGVAGTTTDQVQAAAGVNTSQIYHYFGDKRNLVHAVIGYQTDSVLAAQQPLLSHVDSMAALRSWRDAMVAAQLACDFQGGCAIGSLASELNESDPQARTELAASFQRWGDAFRDGLRAMYERGELRPDADPDTLALGLLAALQGGLLLSQTRREATPLEAALDTVLDRIESLIVGN